MADVSFEEPTYHPAPQAAAKQSSTLSRVVISWGLAKDEAGAQQVLLIIAILAIIATIALFAFDAYRVKRAQAPAGPTNIPGQF